MRDVDDWTIYGLAADAITERDIARYEAIRAAATELDWGGHDRRAALATGASLAQLGPDPDLTPYSITPDPVAARMLAIRKPLTARQIAHCSGCGRPIWWWAETPFDVQNGRGTLTNHFITCPKAAEFKPSRRKKKAA